MKFQIVNLRPTTMSYIETAMQNALQIECVESDPEKLFECLVKYKDNGPLQTRIFLTLEKLVCKENENKQVSRSSRLKSLGGPNRKYIWSALAVAYYCGYFDLVPNMKKYIQYLGLGMLDDYLKAHDKKDINSSSGVFSVLQNSDSNVYSFLGLCYEHGWGVSKCLDTAIAIYKFDQPKGSQACIDFCQLHFKSDPIDKTLRYSFDSSSSGNSSRSIRPNSLK